MKLRFESEPINLGFQIAPVIDVVFVIMLFYMVRAAQVKEEHRVTLTLPHVMEHGAPTDVRQVEELLLTVDEEGAVSLNDEEVGAADDTRLESLATLLGDIRKGAGENGLQVLVTLQTEETTPYQRVMDVMNALTKAKISNLTFTVGEDPH